MKIEELKNQWTTHNTELTKRLEVNESIIKKLSFDRINHEAKTMYNYEIITILTCLATSYFVVHWMSILSFTIEAFALGTASILLILIIGVFSYLKLKKIKSINQYDDSITEHQKQTNNLIFFLIRLKRYEYILNFLLFSTSTPLILNVYGGLNIGNYNLTTYLIYVTIGFSIMMLIDLFLFKRIYTKRIEQIKKQFENIKSFETVMPIQKKITNI